jgi:hypothetical protein
MARTRTAVKRRIGEKESIGDSHRRSCVDRFRGVEWVDIDMQ